MNTNKYIIIAIIIVFAICAILALTINMFPTTRENSIKNTVENLTEEEMYQRNWKITKNISTYAQ